MCGYNLGINRVLLLNFLGLHIVNSLCTIAVISRIPQHVLNCIIILIVLPLNLLNMVTRLAAGFFFLLQQILQNRCDSRCKNKFTVLCSHCHCPHQPDY